MNKLFFLCLLVLSGVSLTMGQSDDDKWSGFYVGGNGFVSSNKTDVAATLQINQLSNLFVAGRGIVIVPSTSRDFAASQRKTNGNGGFQAGYQWQSGKFVFGGEADLNPFRRTVSVSQSFQMPPTLLTPTTTVTAQRDAQLSGEFSLRGRAGAAVGKTLIYGTGGYDNARVRVTSTDSYTNPGGAGAGGFNAGAQGPINTTANESRNMGGWTLGGGFEQKISKRISFGFEYRHTDLRSKTFTLNNQTTVNTGPSARGSDGVVSNFQGDVSTQPTQVSLKSDSFIVKVNFHF